MKILSIQYWRAVAALMVVVAHMLLHPLAVPDVSYRRLGSFGVLLFFVISGFIMVYTTGRGRFDRWDFLRRRFERIVPLYWLVTLGIALLAIVAPSVLKNTSFSWPGLATSLLFIPYARHDGEIVPLMKLGWSLNYEVFFYLLFAAAASMGARERTLFLTLLFIALSILGLLVPFSAAIPYFYTQPVILSFCVGMGIGLWAQDERLLRYSPAIATGWALLALLAIAAGFSVPHNQPIGPMTDACFVAASAALLLCGLALEARLPASPFGLALGNASYAIYLIHMYVVGFAGVAAHRVAPAHAQWLVIAIGLPVTVILAILTHRLIERPIARLLKRRHEGRHKVAPAG